MQADLAEAESSESDGFTQAQFEEEYAAAAEEYTLTQSLTLTSDLTLDHSIIVASGGLITVPNGVTLTVSYGVSVEGGAVKVLPGGVLKVEWTGMIFVGEGVLSVAEGGAYINNNSVAAISLDLGSGTVEGIAEAEVQAHLYATTPSQVSEALAAETEYDFFTVYITEDMELPNLTVTGKKYLCVNREDVTATIPQGVTVTTAMPISVMGTLRVAGTLNGLDGIAASIGDTGKLIVDGGKVAGEIQARTVNDDPSEVTERIIGWNPDDFEITKTSTGYGYVYWRVQYTHGLTKLAAPTNLVWGLDYAGASRPGSIRWTPTEPNQGQYMVTIYRLEEDGSTTRSYGSQWDFGKTASQSTYLGTDTTCLDLESGTYYFTLTALGDGIDYCDSDTVRSDSWTYTKPDRKIDAVYTDLTWNGLSDGIYATAQLEDPTEEAGGWELWLYFSKDENLTPRQVGANWVHLAEQSISYQVWDNYIQQNGAGWYYFRVRALSADITAACNGEWSEMSPGYHLLPDIEDVKQRLDAITVSEDSTEEEKSAAISEIQAVDTGKLKNAMLADSTVVDRLAQVEQTAAGGPAQVEVTPEADSQIEQSKVSVVGANLNQTEAAAEPIRLIVDKPQADHVLPAQFDNALAVKFSMTLENVAAPHALEVPVQVKLPVPASINPSFLVILHYSVAGGEPEQIWPHITIEDGQVYAVFVLTGFSDFAMVQEIKPERIPGDVNGDSVVNGKDSALLAQYLAGWDVSIDLDAADVNDDGKVNGKDSALIAQYLAGWDVVLK